MPKYHIFTLASTFGGQHVQENLKFPPENLGPLCLQTVRSLLPAMLLESLRAVPKPLSGDQVKKRDLLNVEVQLRELCKGRG